MIERCTGKYDFSHGEFGKVIRRECIGCQRRTQPGAPMPVPQFAIGEFGQVIRRECIGCQRRTATGKPMPVPQFEVGCPKKVSETE